MSSFVYNYGGLYLDKGVAVFNSKPALDAIRFYGKIVGTYGPKGVTSMSWENILPLFQAGKIAMWTDASVFFGQLVDPAKSQVAAENVGIANFPAGLKKKHPVSRRGLGYCRRQPIKAQRYGDEIPRVGDEQGLCKTGHARFQYPCGPHIGLG